MAAYIERDERCLFIGNLDSRVTEEILWELFLQSGPLEAVHIPKDKETGRQKSYGFIRFSHEVSVPYTISLMNGITLYGRAITVKKSQQTTNSPGNQSPSSFPSPPLFVNQNGQPSPFPSPHQSNYGCGISNISPLHRPLFDYHREQSSPSNYSHGVSNTSLRGQLGFEYQNGQSNPNSSRLPFPPARNEIDYNSPSSHHPFSRDQRDQMSPWQQNRGRDYQGRPIHQSGRSLSSKFLPRGTRDFRTDFI
ncbi:RNA-binding protein 7-like [Orbicella faveolata]|uniref:RNA-binding protein 7-like n=1 Tax=Orbicella faveolata TaxID=48498 RepID=UPI0009E628E2|nr:RNA-binding protein 7-like [Orbicella faveolata]